jgi:DNA-damage-inducible protein J
MRQTTSVKLDKDIKQEAQKIFAELGLTLGEAINLFLNQVRLNKGLPFEVKIPNDETQKAIEDVRNNKNLQSVTFEQMQEDMKKCIVK